MSRARRETIAGYVWISPWLIGFVLFLAFPAGMSLYLSFTDYPLLESPVWIGTANYERMLSDRILGTTLVNTAVYAVATIPLSIALSVVLAALINTRGLVGRRFFEATVFVPTLVPLVASAMVWMWLFNGEYGVINALLEPIWPGIKFVADAVLPEGAAQAFATPPNWLLDKNWAMPALILIAVWGVGQSTILSLAALREVPQQLYEAAELDGMGPVRAFIHVTLPMISPVVLFNSITMMIGVLQVFVVPYIIFQKERGGPGMKGYFYTSYLYDNAFSYGQMGYACAMAWVQMLIILALTGLMFFASRKLVHYRAA
jgi:multiple sugar transport system permease protein